MEIKRFFSDTSASGGLLYITGDELNHLTRVLRYKEGYKAIVCNGDGNDYMCTLVSVTPHEAVARIDEVCPCAGEADTRVTLYQALPKSSKIDYIVQKAVELGVDKIVFFRSRYSQTEQFNQSRADRIATEACKQCGRARKVQVCYYPSMEEALASRSGDILVMPYEKADKGSMREAVGKSGSVDLVIGSEGGFSDEEAEYVKKCSGRHVTLGRRILRCETAAAVSVALVMYERGELGR